MLRALKKWFGNVMSQAGRIPSPGLLEALILVALLTAYGVFLILGTFVHTARLDEHFLTGTFTFCDICVTLTCWTWTNLLILCCLSSVIGELGRRLLLGAGHAVQVRAALVRGFLILLAIMGGQFIILGTPGATPVPVGQHELNTHICLQHFFRLAAFASLVSLVVALHPPLIRALLAHSPVGNGWTQRDVSVVAAWLDADGITLHAQEANGTVRQFVERRAPTADRPCAGCSTSALPATIG